MKGHAPATTALVVALVMGLLATPSYAATATTFSGQATLVKGQLEGITIGPVVDTGPVTPSGGHIERSLLDYPISGLPDPLNGALTASVLHATVVAHGNKSTAEATVASFSLSAAGQAIGARFLSARASATCNGGTATISGSSEIVGLTINGQTIAVSGAVDQTVPVPGFGVVIINEQVGSVSASGGDITVNALHIMLTDPVLHMPTDLVIASAHADIVCGGEGGTCANQDFVTGGGWITTMAGARASFAVAGGQGGWGHLQYIDHGTGMKVKGTGVTVYDPTGPTSRHIEGTAEIDGRPGTYQADVDDQGEPGRSDTIWLRLSNGYMQRHTLDGGNIQLHCK